MKRIIKRLLAALVVLCMVAALLPAMSYEVVKAEETNEMDVGDYVQFGQYWDDPIVWRVINKNDDGSLMLYSDRILCCKAFDANGDTTDGRDDAEGNRVKYGSNNWEKSNLREWLNSEDTVVQYSHQKPDAEHLRLQYNYSTGEDGPGYNPYDKESGFLSNFTKAEQDVIAPYEHDVILSEVDKDIRTGGSEEYIQTRSSFQFPESYDFRIDIESYLAAGQNFWIYDPKSCENANINTPIKIKTDYTRNVELTIEGDTYRITLDRIIDGKPAVYEKSGTIDKDEINFIIIDNYPLHVVENQHIGANVNIVNNSGKKINIYQPNYSKRVMTRDRDGEVILGTSEKENALVITSPLINNINNSYYKNIMDKVFLLDTNQLTNYVYNRGWEFKSIPTFQAVLNSDYKYEGYFNDKDTWFNWILAPLGSGVRLADGLGEASSLAYDGSIGVCPALNLKAGVKTSGGDGSQSDPFVVLGEEGFESPIARSDVGSVPLTSNYVVVGDYYSKKPIAGASIKIGDQIVKTDMNGMVELDSLPEGKYDLNIEATDYQSHACVYDLKLGRVEIFYLKPDKQFLEPYITKINLNDGNRDYDLLRQVKEYRKISSDSDIKLEDYCCIKMEAERRGKTVKYILSQGWDKKLESVSGQFDAVAIGRTFEPGKKIYAIVQAEDGTSSEPIATNLSVFSSRFEGSIGSESEGSLNLGSKTGVTIPGNLPVIGGAEINFGFGDIPLTYSEEGDNFKIAFGLKKEAGVEEDVTKSKQSWSNLKKAIKEFKTNRDDFSKFKDLNKMLNTKKACLTTVVGWDTEAEVCGYIEGVKQKNGSLIVSEGSLLLNFGFKASKSMQYIVGPVPVYLTVEGGIKVETLSEITKYILESNEVILNTDLKFIPRFELEGGVGVVGVCTVGASGEAELEFLLKYPENYAKISLTGKMNLKAKALIFEAKKEIAKGTWNIYEGNVAKDSGIKMAPNYKPLDVYDEASYTVMPRDYINKPSVWSGDSKLKRSLGVMLSSDYTNKEVKTLQTNIYPDAQPQLAIAGDKRVMVWVADNAERSAVNRTMLVYSIYDNATDTWSAPVAVDDNSTADFYPSLASDNENLYLVWQDSNKVFDDSVTLEDAAASGEIAVAKFNPETNTFDNASKLTDNDTVDTQPQIAVEGGKAFVVWTSNSENNLFGNSGQNTIYYSELNTGTWSSPTVLVSGLNAVTSLDAGYMDNSFRTAYVTDQDNDLDTIDDRDVSIATPDEEVIKLTNNQTMDSAPVFADFDGSNALYWYNDSNISYLTSISGIPSTIFEEAQHGLRDDFEVVNNCTGKTAVIWTGTEEGITEINAVMYDKDKGLWSEDVKISDIGSKVQFPSGVFDENGNFNIAFNKLTTTEEGIEQSDLCTVKVTPSYNIAVNDVSFDPKNMIPGSEMPIEVEVENKGELSVDQFKIDVSGENGSKNSVVETVTILPGETKVINATLHVGDIVKKSKYTVTVTPSAGNEFDTSDNAKEFTAGYTDIALDIEQNSFEDMDTVTVNLSNLSHVCTGAKLKIREGSIDGNVIDTKEIANIVNGQNLSYIYNIDKNTLKYAEGIKQLYFTVESDVEEISTGDNSDFVVISEPMPEFVYGDVNDDGLVNSIDFGYMRLYLIGMRQDFPSNNGKAAADVTGDGLVNSIDFAYMRQYLIGMINKFPIEMK